MNDEGKISSCVDLKKVVKQIETKPSTEFFQATHDKNIKKLFEKDKFLFFNQSELNDAIVMTIPVKSNSSKKWILIFSNIEKSKLVFLVDDYF